MSRFDDLIPSRPSAGGFFSDLIPNRSGSQDFSPDDLPEDEAPPSSRFMRQSQRQTGAEPPVGAGEPAPTPERTPAPAPASPEPVSRVDTTDDARAARGFGRSAYQSGLVDAPNIPGADVMGTGVQRPARGRGESDLPDDGIGTLGRIGRSFAQGEAQAITAGKEGGRRLSAAMEEGPIGRAFYKLRQAVGIETDTPEERAEAIRNEPRGQIEREAEARLEEIQREGFQITGLGDIDGIASAGRFVAENTAMALPYMVAGLGAGPTQPQVMMPLLSGEVFQELDEKLPDMPEREKANIAAGAGAAMWALETVGLGAVVGKILPSDFAKRALRGELADTLMKRGLKRSAARLIEAGVVEGSTEALQEGVIIAAVGFAGGEYTREEITERLTGAFAGGAGAGVGLRAGVEVASGGRRDDDGREFLTPEDKASPIPDDILGRGKRTMAEIEAKKNRPTPPQAGVAPLDEGGANVRTPRTDAGQQPSPLDRLSPDRPQQPATGLGRDPRRAPAEAPSEAAQRPEAAETPESASRTPEPAQRASEAAPIPPDRIAPDSDVDMVVGDGEPTTGRIVRMTQDGPVLRDESGDEYTVPQEDIDDGEILLYERGQAPRPEQPGTPQQPQPAETPARRTPETGPYEERPAAQAAPEIQQQESNDQARQEPVPQVESPQTGETPQGVAAPTPGQAAAPARRVRPARTGPRKRPLTAEIGATIDPDGEAGRELRAAGITPQNTPRLFRRGGLRDLDNLVASENPYLAEVLPGDGSGNYIDRNSIIDAIISEFNGRPVQDAAEMALEMNARSREKERRRKRGEIDGDIEPVETVDQVDRTPFTIPDPNTDISTPQERAESVRSAVKSVERENRTILTDAERRAVYDRLEREGGDVEDIIMDEQVRSYRNEAGTAEVQREGKGLQGGTPRSPGRPQDQREGEAQGAARAENDQLDGRAPERGSRETQREEVAPPTTERTEAGEQTVIPGAEQDAGRSERARRADQRREMEARQQQRRMGTTEPQDGPGGLFDTQGDLLDSTDDTSSKPAVVREWERAENAAYEASSEWNRAREAYRAGDMGDAEFEAARKKHQAALDRADAARTKLDGSRYEAEISPDAARTVTWRDTTAKAANPDSAQGDMLDQAAAPPEQTDQEGATAKDEWRIVQTDDPDPANRFKVMRREGDNQRDVWGYYAARGEAESARDLAERDTAKKAAAQEKRAETIAARKAAEDTARDTPQPARRERIEDFGEKIGGAQKDKVRGWLAQAAEVSDAEIATVPLSKSWPEPNYQELLDAGVDPEAVAFIHAARDEIPSKPRSTWKVERWAKQVKILRGFSTGLIDGTYDMATVKERAQSSGLKGFMGRVDMYERFGHEKSLKNVSMSEGSYSIFKGERFNTPKSIWTVTVKRQIKAHGETKEAAMDAFAEPYAEMGGVNSRGKGTKFEIRKWRGGNVFIGKKIGKDWIEVATDPEWDWSAARKYLVENHEALEAELARKKQLPPERGESNSPRVGEDHRNGQDVTPDMFTDTFGFRGVQFGEYVEGPRRQQDINEAYDGLMDLAGVIGVPPKAMSLNGSLGLAFGARGSGRKAAAHYEPGEVVINLTKKQGAGSLAHEWWHAMDHYFAQQGGRSATLLTENLRGLSDGLRPEVLAEFDSLTKLIRQGDLKVRSQTADKRKSKPYFATMPEMTARGFESYVIGKLQDQSQSNDYLANILSEDAWNALEQSFGQEAPSWPYVKASEMPEFREAFDNLFDVIETEPSTRVNDEGETIDTVRMYQRQISPFYSPLLRAIEGAKQKQAQAKDWKAILAKMPGVKQAEIEWLGVNEWLDAQDGQVRREDIAEFVRESQIEVVEDRLGERPPEFYADMETLRDDESVEGWSDADIEEQVLADSEVDGRYSPARFENYTEDGGENYREVLLRVPDLHRTGKNAPARRGVKTPDDPFEQVPFDADQKRPFVQSAHFEQENIVVHARIKDRTGPNGEKVLFVEEIQSDLASVWRENSESPDVTARRRELNEEYRRLREEIATLSDAAAERIKPASDPFLTLGNISEDINSVSAVPTRDWSGSKGRALELMRERERDTLLELTDLHDRAGDVQKELLALGTEKRIPDDLPDTPFKEEHTYALMVKRLLRMAAEEGYDRLSWTPGYMQAERSNSAAQSVVEGVRWEVSGGAYRRVQIDMADAGGEHFVHLGAADPRIIQRSDVDQWEGKRLADLVGPKLAEQIIAEESGSVSGQKITFPDSGYAIAYDQQIPKAVNKLARGTGAKVSVDKSLPDFLDPDLSPQEAATRDDGSIPVWSIDITDDLRAKALEPMAILRRDSVIDEQKVAALLPDLRKRLDKMLIRGVDLRFEPGMAEQGATEIRPNGDISILIGAALNDVATLNHEAVHVLRARGLFKDREWAALREAAEADWMKRYDIATRYSDLDREGQIEEAVAEAFADWTQGNLKVADAPKGGLARIKRFFRALIETLRGQRITSPSDVFKAIDSGAVGGREGGLGARVGQAAQRASEAVKRWRQGLTQLLQDPSRKFPEISAGRVGQALRAIGVPAGEIYMAGGKVRRVIKEHPEAREALMSLPDLLNDPDAVIAQNRPDSDYRIVTSRRTADGRPIIANLKVDGRTVSGQDARIVMTVYGWQDYERAMQGAESRGAIRYVRDDDTARRLGLKGEAPPKIGNASVRSGVERTILTRADVFKRRDQRQPKRRDDASFSNQTIAEIARLNRETGQPLTPQQMNLPPSFEAPKRTLLTARQEDLQDKFVMFRAAEQVIEETTGKKLPEAMSFSSRETVFRGRTANRLEKVMKEEVRPIMETMKREKASLDDVGLFLIARHAPERNALMAQRNPERFGQGGGSGMTDAAAAQVMQNLRDAGKMKGVEKVAKMVDTMLSRDLQNRRLAGLISDTQMKSWKAMYKHYTPLRGFAEREDGDQVGGTGAGFNIRGKEVIAATGRSSLSDNPLVQAIEIRQQGVVRAEKNRVGKALLKLTQKYPNPDLWEMIGKLPTREVLNRDTGMVQKMTDFQALNSDELLGVKINGDTRYIRIKDPLMAAAAKNLDSTIDNEVVAKFLNGMKRVTNAWARNNTGANPGFVIPNAIGDFLEGLWTAYNITDTKGMMRAFLRYYPVALYQGVKAEFLDSAVGRKVTGETDKAIERLQGKSMSEGEKRKFDRYREEWEKDGGRISFMAFRDLDEITRDINKEIRRADQRFWQVKPWEAVEEVIEVIAKVNQPFESAARMATYIAARERGLSKERAAALSLDASGNYYRGGRTTPFLKPFYAFWNPAVQGIEKFLRFAKRPRNAPIIGGVALTGYYLAMSNMQAWGDDDDPEETPLYLMIPEWERSRALIIPYGTKEVEIQMEDGRTETVTRLEYASIRIPHNLRPLLTMGDQMAALAHASQTKSPVKHTTPESAAREISRSILMNTNPFGSENLLTAISPTVTDPFADILQNRTWSGGIVHPNEYPWTQGIPKSQQFFERSTSDAAVATAQALNRITGGSALESGALDFYPDDLEHLFNYATGGLGREIERSAEAALNAAQGVETKTYRKPIVRSFSGATTRFAESERYYELRQEAQDNRNRIRQAKRMLEQNPNNKEAREDLTRLMREMNVGFKGERFDWTNSLPKIFDKTDEELKALRDQVFAVQNDERLSRPERIKRQDELNLQIEMMQREARRRYVDLLTELGQRGMLE